MNERISQPEFGAEELAEIDRLAEQWKGENKSDDDRAAREVAMITIRSRRYDARQKQKDPTEYFERKNQDLR
jgi:hypothetical protein